MRASALRKFPFFRLRPLLWAVFLSLVALPAQAQFTRDAAATKKIDEAINQHYVATDFEKAEGVLLGTINACGDKCSPAVLAKGWMYVGIVRGSGRNNQAGAKEAFQKAVAADPQVKLDMVLATPETQATFNDVAGGGGAAVAPVPVPGGETPVPAGPTAGGLVCTPEPGGRIETRRVIPVECKSDEEVTAMELRYKSFGSEKWVTVQMTKKGDGFRAEVPCTATKNVGPVKLYVRAKDAGGEEVDSWGKKTAPVEFQMAEGVVGEPPAYPDADAPARCVATEECPPDFPGCGETKGAARGNKDWGEACDNSTQCKSGLLCQDGTCQTAPSCETNADCETGSCVSGTCDIPIDVGPTAPFKKNWFGIHLAQDFAIVGGSNVCDANLGQKSDNYACFYEGTTDEPFWHTPFPYKDGITTGSALATTRVLISYDRAFTPNLTIGGRVGYAFGGGPPAGQEPTESPPGGSTNLNLLPDNTKGKGGSAFLPIHAEVRGTFWFLPLNAKLFRAYAALGGGMAQVDAKVSVPERDCADTLENPATPEDDWDQAADGDYDDCRTGRKNFNWKKLKETPVNAWKKMGRGFGTVAVGGMLAFKDNMGVQLNLNFMYMLPASGFVMEPSLGFVMGL